MKPNWKETSKADRALIINEGVEAKLVSADIAELFTGCTSNAIRAFSVAQGIKLVPQCVASAMARRKEPRTSSSIIRAFFAIVDREGVPYKKIAALAGLHHTTLSFWRTKNSPRLIDFENAAQAVGLRLELVPITEAEE